MPEVEARVVRFREENVKERMPTVALLLFPFIRSAAGVPSSAQAIDSGTITGTIADPSGAAIPSATVRIENPVRQYERATETDSTGRSQFANVPRNAYHMTVAAKGFGAAVQDVEVSSVGRQTCR